MEQKQKEDVVFYLTQLLYKQYGSDSGFVFGIKPSQKDAVTAIIGFVVNEITQVREE